MVEQRGTTFAMLRPSAAIEFVNHDLSLVQLHAVLPRLLAQAMNGYVTEPFRWSDAAVSSGSRDEYCDEI
ncbi:hypothetical protein EYD00_25690 (plasmid) [Agrobacterium sp. 33MFTa1.1]|uniref:hypothetical protein n=1 Tax=Agrobacterium sp. 33MFTa1.1 TaxID=1279031 RepID=UPI00103DC428|nr:hypothetical protein [Agrobacterium sp. 33MFTa1.1]QBJ16821.1 hypothetical protein EYD00_25690 [Agrobacterium sp. 33MFTa1.1]